MTRHAAGFLTFGAASSFGRFSILGLLIQRYHESFTNSRVDSPTQVLHLEWLQPTKPPLNTTNMFYHQRIHWLKHLHSHHCVCVDLLDVHMWSACTIIHLGYPAKQTMFIRHINNSLISSGKSSGFHLPPVVLPRYPHQVDPFHSDLITSFW